MKKRDTAVLAFLLSVLLVGGAFESAYGQETQGGNDNSARKLSDLSLTDLLNVQVTTASKKAEKSTDAPGVIETITSDEIKAFGANSLLDILQRATSIQPMSVSVFPNQFALIRGDLRSNQDNHVLLLLDGRPVREGTNGGTDEAFFSSFPISAIDHIEIIRGPGSVLYGSNAFVGVINIITKSEDRASISASATGGSFGTASGSVTGTVVSGDLKANVSAKLDNITGWDFSAMTKRPGFPDSSVSFDMGQKNVGIVGDISYDGLRLTGFYAHTLQNMLGIIPYATFAGKNKFEKLFLNLGYDYKFNDVWTGSVNLTDNSDILHIDQDATGTAEDHHQSLDYLGEVTINGAVADNANVVFGGVVESRNKNVAEPTSVVPAYHQTNLSAYFQGDYKPIDALKLIAGGQFNHPDNGSWSLVPRVGAIYDFTSALGMKVLYGQAFRAPYPMEQYIHNPTLVGNPNLTPEKIGTLDAQLFYSLSAGQVSLTFFNSNYMNSITRVPTANPSVATFANEGNLTVNGVELEGKYSPESNILVTGSATYQKNENDAMVTPNLMAKLGVMYNTDFGVKIGLFNSYFGAPKSNGAPAVNPPATAVSLFSANIAYRIPVSVPLELSVYAENLFNVSYNFTEFNRDWVNTVPVGPGRSVYVSAGISL